ncbi:MAG: ribbon-helix-helix protein, CopG family [Candidatus Micrarchaeia archaeon]
MEYYSTINPENGNLTKRNSALLEAKVTIEEKKELEEIAKEEGVTISSIIRKLVRQYLKDRSRKAIY